MKKCVIESLETRRMLTSAVAFATSDMAGTWFVGGMGSTGAVVIDSTGTITGGSLKTDAGVTSVPSGTVLISSGGNVSTIGAGAVSGAMNASKGLIVTSNTSTDSLAMLVRSGATFVNSDLSGAWSLFTNGDFGDDPANGVTYDNSGHGTLNFDGSSSASGNYTTDETNTSSPLTASYNLGTNGAVSFIVNGSNAYVGLMATSKDVVVLSPADLTANAAAHDTKVTVLVHRGGGAYSVKSLTGTWQINLDGAVGNVTFDGAGKISTATLNSTNGAVKGTGSYAVSADGTVTLNMTLKGAAGTFALKYVGALAAGRDVAVMDRPNNGANGVDDMAVMVKAGQVNHAPTMTAIKPLATATAGSAFTITYAQLKAASNAADLDGDPISFAVTAVAASGTLAINGVAASAGATIGAGDVAVWTPPVTAGGSVTAFTVKASDGAATSAKALAVKVTTTGRAAVGIVATKPAASEVNDGKAVGVGVMTLTRTGGNLKAGLSVGYTVSGTATNGVDYKLLSGTAVFAAGKATTTLSILPMSGDELEPVEDVVVMLSESATYNLTTKKSATVKIADGTPGVSVAAKKPTATEKGASGEFLLTRTGGNLKKPLVVNYSLAGTAVNGVDYKTLSGVATFAVGKTTAEVDVAALADQETEGNETVVLTINQAVGYTVKGSFSTVTIIDTP